MLGFIHNQFSLESKSAIGVKFTTRCLNINDKCWQSWNALVHGTCISSRYLGCLFTVP
ncbi:conserved hypothetical protein [Ricinus communis]|uniref:Uncharacterized protein n=1 Tax=Ricinus communis TaxID=3988 RepID=B9RL22_RICCO|nr:conserved hypothetical protein [Ricinus communis]